MNMLEFLVKIMTVELGRFHQKLEILPQVVKLTIENSERYFAHFKF